MITSETEVVGHHLLNSKLAYHLYRYVLWPLLYLSMGVAKLWSVSLHCKTHKIKTVKYPFFFTDKW